MDILFENNYNRTKELTQEFYKYYYFQRPVYIIFGIIFGLFFITCIASLMINPSDVNIIALITAIMLFALHFFTYYKMVKTTVKRDNEMSGGNNINVNIIVTNDIIRYISSTGSVEIPFSKIKKVAKTKNLILLCSEAKLVYIFPKETFTKGSANEFLLFLKTKGISK